MERLLAVSDEGLAPVLITALHTGLRRGGLFHLTWQDIDFKLGVVRVRQNRLRGPVTCGQALRGLERDTGLEPATFALARRRSTN